jgi:hypothetical protein
MAASAPYIKEAGAARSSEGRLAACYFTYNRAIVEKPYNE